MMGAERRSMVMTEDEKKLTAYHEGGHAIVALNEKASDPIHKATIIPRGRALGMVMRLPERDQLSVTREKLHSDIAVAMGGRIAEEIIFGHDKVTSGASSDIEMVTKMAKNMVTKYGMSNELGTIAYGENEEEVFLKKMPSTSQSYSSFSERQQFILDSLIRKSLVSKIGNKPDSFLVKKNRLVLSRNFFDQPYEVIFRSLSDSIKTIGNKYYPARGKKIDKIIVWRVF